MLRTLPAALFCCAVLVAADAPPAAPPGPMPPEKAAKTAVLPDGFRDRKSVV